MIIFSDNDIKYLTKFADAHDAASANGELTDEEFKEFAESFDAAWANDPLNRESEPNAKCGLPFVQYALLALLFGLALMGARVLDDWLIEPYSRIVVGAIFREDKPPSVPNGIRATVDTAPTEPTQ